MWNSAASAQPLRVSEIYRGPCRVDDAEPQAVQFLDRGRDQNADPTSPLDRYIEGWAQIDLEKILAATAPTYRFTDPFVGSFDGRSLHKYFDLLQERLSCTGAISRRELAFFLQGPMTPRSHKELQFWREAPRIGLTGVAEIEIGEGGVAAERVAYDLNLASDILCRALACADPISHAPEKRSTAGTLPKPIEHTLKIRSNVNRQPLVITPKCCQRPLQVLGEHSWHLRKLQKVHALAPCNRHEKTLPSCARVRKQHRPCVKKNDFRENTMSNEGRRQTRTACRAGVNPAQHRIVDAHTSRYAESEPRWQRDAEGIGGALRAKGVRT